MKNTVTILSLLIATILPTQAQLVVWDADVSISSGSTGYYRPMVVTDGSGNPMVLWNNAQSVYFSRWDGSAFTAPVKINPEGVNVAGSYWMGPDIASKGDTVYIVYKETPEDQVGKHAWCVASFDGGATFGAPVQVDNLGNDALSRFTTVAVDELGNPVVAFMKFTTSFENHEWAVCTSNDYGQSFSTEVVASGWSSVSAEACDCCSSTLVQSNGNVAMLYRDNNSNIRDSWAGISTDGGATFSGGVNMDQQNWYIASCPSSGPDGFILGDTIYSTFMSSASGKGRVYYSKSSISGMNSQGGVLLTDMIDNLGSQNFPRISTNGTYMATAWIQNIGPQKEIAFNFSNNLNGFDKSYEVIYQANTAWVDIAMVGDQIYLVWQDESDDVLRFKKGRISPIGIAENTQQNIQVMPNPASQYWNIQLPGNIAQTIHIYDLEGKLVYAAPGKGTQFTVDNQGWADGVYILKVDGLNTGNLQLIKYSGN